ncbi:MMP13 [Acrasis kona]|uniref:MMP13 n=1 Tax=Acrasis kona TaxID=1008807 RepID=A0AAW2ZEN7_9EUKA
MSNFKVYKPFNKEEPREEPAPPKFLVDDKGHLINRNKDEGTHSFPQFESSGGAGFTFTPMSYVRHEVRPNVKVQGVRSELGNTNPTAHHYLPKSEEKNDHKISISVAGTTNERTLSSKPKLKEYYDEQEPDSQFTNGVGGLGTKTLTRLQHLNKKL